MIDKVCVANRGEIARRVFRTCRAMGIGTVALYSDADADAPHVRDADEAVPIGGTGAASSYLRIDAVVAAALRAGADAVHPGYGFLSENADFAQAVLEAGLVWIGPSPAAIRTMGSKLAARALMTAAGVPVLPGAELTGADDRAWHAVATEVGLPAIVKAAFGGGGRGMRVVRTADELTAAVTAARREAASAFGDDTVFLERFVEQPRHIEVQVLADRAGTTIHCFERECSVQRRHQKVIEEAPSPFLDDDVRAALGTAAVRAAEAVGYEGAGTVEFVVDRDGHFFFLEMNTRLQVEHPVTELVTGLDLVRAQIEIAGGAPLPDAVRDRVCTGHAIEARLYAEDPAAGYRPVPGRVADLAFPDDVPVRVDAGVERGTVVSSHYDPMMAKVIAHAPTREKARRVLVAALRRARIHHEGTNRDLLLAVLEHPDFVAGEVDTGFLDRHDPVALTAGVVPAHEVRLAVAAAALAASAAARADAPVLATVPAGWRNNPSQPQCRRFTVRDGEHTVAYDRGRDPRIVVDGDALDAAVVSVAPSEVVLVVDGVRRTWTIATDGDVVYVDGSRGAVVARAVPRFVLPGDAVLPGSQRAPMPGTVVHVSVAVGDRVAADDPLVVLEAMKMQHEIRAPFAGFVAEVPVAVGDSVATGTVLVVVAADEDGSGTGG